MRTLTAAQVSTGLLPKIRDDRLFAAIFLLFGTGLRRGELLGLRWHDVDMAQGILHIRQTLVRVRTYDTAASKTTLLFQAPKTAAARRAVPIPAACLSALQRHKARQAEEKLRLGAAYSDHGLVFCRPSGLPMPPTDFGKHFRQLLTQAGVPAIRLHDTRHTFATLMLELGESPKTVQTMLGHTSVSITLDLYSHVSLELETRAAARLGDVLMGEK